MKYIPVYIKYIYNTLFHKLHMLDNTDMIWYQGRRLM